MRRIDFHRVRQAHKFFMQRFVHHSRHHFGSIAFAAGEIRPANVADEECIASQKLAWLSRNFSVSHEDINTFRRVTGCFHESQLHAADVQFVTILDRVMRKRDVSLLSKNYFSAGACSQFSVTTDKIRVEVGFDNILDPEAV